MPATDTITFISSPLPKQAVDVVKKEQHDGNTTVLFSDSGFNCKCSDMSVKKLLNSEKWKKASIFCPKIVLAYFAQHNPYIMNKLSLTRGVDRFGISKGIFMIAVYLSGFFSELFMAVPNGVMDVVCECLCVALQLTKNEQKEFKVKLAMKDASISEITRIEALCKKYADSFKNIPYLPFQFVSIIASQFNIDMDNFKKMEDLTDVPWNVFHKVLDVFNKNNDRWKNFNKVYQKMLNSSVNKKLLSWSNVPRNMVKLLDSSSGITGCSADLVDFMLAKWIDDKELAGAQKFNLFIQQINDKMDRSLIGVSDEPIIYSIVESAINEHVSSVYPKLSLYVDMEFDDVAVIKLADRAGVLNKLTVVIPTLKGSMADETIDVANIWKSDDGVRFIKYFMDKGVDVRFIDNPLANNQCKVADAMNSLLGDFI